MFLVYIHFTLLYKICAKSNALLARIYISIAFILIASINVFHHIKPIALLNHRLLCLRIVYCNSNRRQTYYCTGIYSQARWIPAALFQLILYEACKKRFTNLRDTLTGAVYKECRTITWVHDHNLRKSLCLKLNSKPSFKNFTSPIFYKLQMWKIYISSIILRVWWTV